MSGEGVKSEEKGVEMVEKGEEGKNVAGEDRQEGTKPKDSKEGREVQPKKIPIGGIQMPGFFTRSRSKEKCKEGENGQNEDEPLDPKEKDEPKTQQTRIKLPNPFRRSKVLDEDEEKTGEVKEKKKLLDTIRLPLVNVFPRKKKDDTIGNQSAVAGLASMETLDDNDKDLDKKEETMKSVCLDVNVDEKKDLEKQELAQTTWREKLKSYRVVISATLGFITLLIIMIIVALPTKPNYSVPIRDGRYVETITSCGRVEGLVEDGAVAFRGIPYARPPIGDLRFKPAKPLNSLDFCWNNSQPLLAHNATDYCMQIYDNGTAAGVEDCLTLDVVTPYVRYDTPLPVIVLVGADSLIGGSPGKMRPSARYARSRDVIFVRPNFRLGALGFLAVDVLSRSVHPPTSGNYGLSDIIEVLVWVQYNIEHFGGDPKAVTLFGHRAGATLVTALSTTRNAKKLFARAWAASGGAIYPGKTLVEYESANKNYLSAVQCSDLDCLLKQEAEVLVNSVMDTWRKPQPDLPPKTEDSSQRHEWLILDGDIIREHPAKVWIEQGLPVPLVLGTTAHAAASSKLLHKHKEWTEGLVKQHVKESKLGESNLGEEALKLYPSTYQGLTAMISDIRIVCPLLAVATQIQNVSFYVVTQERGEHELADIDSDIDAIFGRYEPKTVEQRRYVSSMQQLFYYYVWHGKIAPAKSAPNNILIVEQDVTVTSNYTHCDYWIKNDIVPRYAQLD